MDSKGSEQLEAMIYEIRGQKVMLDADLARLYGVETKALNRAVNRNSERFPPDFMVQLTENEEEILRCQIGTLRFAAWATSQIPPLRLHRTRHRHALQRPSSGAEAKIAALEKNTSALFKLVFERHERVEKRAPVLPPHRRKIGF